MNWYWNWGLRFLMSASSWANKLTSASNVSCNCAQSKVCNLGRRPNVAWQKGGSKVRQHDPITMTRTQNEGKQLQMPCVLVSQNLGPSVKKSLPTASDTNWGQKRQEERGCGFLPRVSRCSFPVANDKQEDSTNTKIELGTREHKVPGSYTFGRNS